MTKITFLLGYEDDAEWITMDSLILKSVLELHKDKYDYIILNSKEFYSDNKLKDKNEFPKEYENSIPVGSIQFVNNFINIFIKEFDGENSIEIPPVLRKYEFLKRQYKILPYGQINDANDVFIKDAEGVKTFSNNGEYGRESINKDHLFIVSEKIDVKAEYRIYVIRNKVKNICRYLGDPLYLPDLSLVNKMVNLYSMSSYCPQSYSIDVMVNDKGTALLEVHSFSSLGLFSTKWDEDLALAEVDGFNYIVNMNPRQTSFQGFENV